jgi:DNA invertase Pin-like site-specific DNA recombinase
VKRVLAYARISRADWAREQSLGFDAQRAAFLAAATHQGWDIVGWYTDDGVSGRTLHRPGITAALAELKAHRADGVVAAKLDRLSRSVADFAALLDTSRRQGWDVAVLTSSSTPRPPRAGSSPGCSLSSRSSSARSSPSGRGRRSR